METEFRWHSSFTSFAKKLARTRKDHAFLALKNGEKYTASVSGAIDPDDEAGVKTQIDEKVNAILAYFKTIQDIGGANVVVSEFADGKAEYFGIEVSDRKSWKAMTAEKTIEVYPGLNDKAKENMITPEFLAY